MTLLAVARVLRTGTSHLPFEDGCGSSLEACVGLDFLRLTLERKYYFEEGDHNHASLSDLAVLLFYIRLLRRDAGFAM